MSLPKLNLDLKEENSSESEPILGCKDEKIVEVYLKYNGEESISDNKFIELGSIKKIEYGKEKFEQKNESHFKLEIIEQQEVEIKYEENKLNEMNINKEFEVKIVRSAIKKEVKTENATVDELFTESPFKPENIQQEEVHVKSKEDKKERINKRTGRSGNGSVLHQCPECSYSTNRKYNLKLHSVRHKKPDEVDSYSCRECPYKTSRKDKLRSHAELHNNLTFKCSKCSYETSRSANLRKHQIKHTTNVQWLHCSECSYKTHQRYLLRNHKLAHKSDSFKCPNCPYQARRKRQLTIHQVKHESMDKWHSCPLCPYKTYSKTVLKAHCRRCHGTDTKNSKQFEMFKCAECSYKSGSKDNMKRHQLIHDRSGWFQCSDCAYKTRNKRNMNRHQMWHQGENAGGWYRCLECFYKTAHKSNLRRHVISHRSTDEIRKFECRQCSFKTAYKNYLMRHQLKHKEPHEIEWFCCYECSFKTKQKPYLIRHISLKHKKQSVKSCL